MPIGGVLTAMVTPFDANGRVDEDAAAELIRHLLANGSDGVVVAGTTGEGTTLDDEEKCRLFELAVAESGDALVVAGTGSNDTAHTVHLTERATEIRVDAHLVVTPCYNKPNARGIVAHFQAVAAATDLPVIAYNIPSRCVVDIPNELLREMAATIPTSRPSSRPTTTASRRSRGSTCWPATTTCSPARWRWAAPAGSWWPRTCSGTR